MYLIRSTFPSISTLIPVLLVALSLAACDNTTSSNRDTGSSGPSFSSGTLGPGDTFSYTFQEEGNVPYYCRTHAPDMTGRVTVAAGAEISGRDTVVMQNSEFRPASITIAPNTEIVWINREEANVADHTVTSGEPPTNDDDDDNGGGY